MTDDARVYRVLTDDLLALRAAGQRLQAPRARSARSALAGAHRSGLHGRGMDYRESRHYQAGDDIRNMDWRITARSGHPHVKVFDEERERPIVVLVDLGATMFFASQGVFKSVQAARLAALIGWSAIARGDRIGGLLFTGAAQGGETAGRHQELPPAGGRRGQMRLIRALVAGGDPEAGFASTAASAAAAASSDENGLNAALMRLGRVARPGSLVFLLSDFYGLDAESVRHLSQLVRHCDLHAVQLVDPLELAPPPPGRYGVSDGRRRWVIDTRVRAERERYAERLSQHHERVRQRITANGIGLTRCSTTDDPSACLSGLFAARAAGRRAGTDGIASAGAGQRTAANGAAGTGAARTGAAARVAAAGDAAVNGLAAGQGVAKAPAASDRIPNGGMGEGPPAGRSSRMGLLPFRRWRR
ncbi:DUF58 domain-containing protein [Halochromatium glycolicum]|uniref:DUF58 domain-containing protein n=1 Tax=Halochromatium glycolicum TaxID=85075 RepID=A0AAJ0U546_9GAMM|nr:DUF58 domain-containing protein [Halochromatium glycolicum]MBK1705449.1 hypothetical protein [Halochromatium glycolicum]